MTKEAVIPNEYGPSRGAIALPTNAPIERLMLPEAGFEFKSFKLVIAVIPIKRMYLERLRKTLTGQ